MAHRVDFHLCLIVGAMRYSSASVNAALDLSVQPLSQTVGDPTDF